MAVSEAAHGGSNPSSGTERPVSIVVMLQFCKLGRLVRFRHGALQLFQSGVEEAQPPVKRKVAGSIPASGANLFWRAVPGATRSAKPTSAVRLRGAPLRPHPLTVGGLVLTQVIRVRLSLGSPSRVRLAGQGWRFFTPLTRVRIPHARQLTRVWPSGWAPALGAGEGRSIRSTRTLRSLDAVPAQCGRTKRAQVLSLRAAGVQERRSTGSLAHPLGGVTASWSSQARNRSVAKRYCARFGTERSRVRSTPLRLDSRAFRPMEGHPADYRRTGVRVPQGAL